MEKLKEKVRRTAAENLEEIISIRRHIHQNPELSFAEFNTSTYISEKLSAFGIPHTTGWVKTGIIGHIQGKNPDKHTVALRADIDALPIKEKNEIDYRSRNEGVMHACGHDAHTASLLGAASILNQLRDRFEGTVKLIFQPGEERNPGGASLLIDEGGLEDPAPSGIFGQHVYPELEAGKVGFRSGQYMASTDEVLLRVKGKGGHAAMPAKTIDPVLATAHILVTLQQVVSRKAPPTEPSVLSFGRIVGAGATNIIPDEVSVEGTFRAFNEEWRAEAHTHIRSLAEQTAKGMGASCEVTINKGYPYLVNQPELTEKARSWAADYLGSRNVVELPMRMTAEDFAYYSQQMPGCFYRLGVRNEEKGITGMLHTDRFNIDENALETGMGLMAWIALNQLGE